MNKPKPWRENSNSFLIIYSILAATCGVFIALIFQDASICKYWWIPIVSLAIAFLLFIFSAEGLTDALDEDDVEKYLAIVFLYNIGVFFLLAGISSSIFFHYLFPHTHNRWLFVAFYLVPGSRWIYYAGWLIFRSEKKYQEYKEELVGGTVETSRCWTSLFLRIRKLLHK